MRTCWAPRHRGAAVAPLTARYNAALTEFWRAHRACAGVLHFCGLGYSRTNGQTCDNFIDIEKLRFEPEFQRYMADAFAPVGLMIDEWRSQLPAGQGTGRARGRHQRSLPGLERQGPVPRSARSEGAERANPSCEVAALGQASLRFACAVRASPETISSKRPCCEARRSRCAACAISEWDWAEDNQGGRDRAGKAG